MHKLVMSTFDQTQQDFLLDGVFDALFPPENDVFMAPTDVPTPAKKTGKPRKTKKPTPTPPAEEEDEDEGVAGTTKRLLYEEGEILTDFKYHTAKTMLLFSSTSSAIKSYGLLKKVEVKFPYARFAPGYNSQGDYYLTCEREDRKKPGEALVYNPATGVDPRTSPIVVDLVTRIIPGLPIDQNEYTRKLVEDSTDAELIKQAKSDTEVGRANWWTESLNHLEKYFRVMNPLTKEIYIPAGIGSSVKDAFWKEQCIPRLEAFAGRMNKKNVKVCVVTRKNEFVSLRNSFKRRGQWDDDSASSKRNSPAY